MRISYLNLINLVNSLVLLSNFWFIQNSIIALITSTLLAYFVFIALKNWLKTNFQQSLILLSGFVVILGTFGYYLYKFNKTGCLILIVCLSIFSLWQNPKIKLALKIPKIFFMNIIYWLNIGAIIFVLFANRTLETIESPWQVLPQYFWLLMILAFIFLISNISNQKNKLNIFNISLFYFVCLSIALFIYKIGYGFDPFIHQATEKHIFENGFILPKQFYYIGQYVLVVFLAHLTMLPIILLDKIILLILYIAIIPQLFSQTISNFTQNKKIIYLTTLAFLIIPFFYFINTTPLSLALLFNLITILLAINYLFKKTKLNFILMLISALTACAIHPLIGIFSFVLILLVYFKKTITKLFLSFLAGFSLFGAFILNAKLNSSQLNFSSFGEILSSIWFDLTGLFHQTYHFAQTKNLIYLFGFNYPIILIVIGLIGLILLAKNHKKLAINSGLFSLIIFVNFIVIKYIINFTNVIDYEKFDFANRIQFLLIVSFLPSFIYILIYLFNQIVKTNKLSQIISFVIFGYLIFASLYTSFPRNDDYINSKIFNASTADFDTINLIEKTANNQPYVVLSNQITSAVALRQFGFSRYYNDYYFYPIPTSAETYAIYLEMVQNKPTLELINQVKTITGVNLVYFIIPSYWSKFETISDYSQAIADDWFSIQNNKILIYQFK